MNIAWAVVIGLFASIIGGLYSGLLILRKNQHDTKRLYAKQMHNDLKLICVDTLNRYWNYIHEIDNEVVDVHPPVMTELSLESLHDLIVKLRLWSQTDMKDRLSEQNMSNVIDNLRLFVSVSRGDFVKFFGKYPTQTIYFDKLYGVSTMFDVPGQVLQHVVLNQPFNFLLDRIQTVHYAVLGIIEDLGNVYSNIEYYRNVKSWTWRIFVPIIPNR